MLWVLGAASEEYLGGPLGCLRACRNGGLSQCKSMTDGRKELCTTAAVAGLLKAVMVPGLVYQSVHGRESSHTF